MGFDFRETLTLEVPHVEEQMSAFSEGEYKREHGLIIEVAAIHEGMTANFNHYPAAALEAALQSWVAPYPKPIIMNHDPRTEAIGRVMAATMAQEADGTPYTKLQAAITDPEAIAKVLDQRYLTGSVGGSATEANCSVCGADWAEASVMNIPCKHQRGKTYKGKLAYMEMNGISFKEYSIVNMPADERSHIRNITTTSAAEAEAEEGWVRPARFFSLDMGKEEIVEFSESKNQNVLAGLKKKESTPVYTNLKGAFLSALVAAEGLEDSEDLSTKESTVPDQLMEEEEDILGTVESLSSDLSSPAATEDEETPEEETASEEGGDDDAPENQEPEVGPAADDEEPEAPGEESEETDEEASTEEGERPEGQEKPNPETPVSREEDKDEEETPEAETADEDDEDEQASDAEEAETDLGEANSALESRVAELEARESALLEENGKLKAALKRNLAERVVDTKIARGLLEAADREAQLEEHTKRSASSLADSLRDFAAMPTIQTRETSILDGPTVEEASAAVSEENTVTEGEDVTESEENDEIVAENVLVDALMGRRSLQF